jgi:hypothetical protein
MHLALSPGVVICGEGEALCATAFSGRRHDDQSVHSFHGIAPAPRLRGRSAELSSRWRSVGRRGLFGAIARQLAVGLPPTCARNSFFSAELFVRDPEKTPGAALDPDFERLQQAKALREGESAPELLQ